MDLGKNFTFDDEKMENGVWVDLEDGQLLIRKMDNPDFTKVFRKKLKPYKGRLDSKKAENDKELRKIVDAITIECMAEYILVGWKNIKDNGKEVKYSKENAAKLMTKYPPFFDIVSDFARDYTLFNKDEVEEIKGN